MPPEIEAGVEDELAAPGLPIDIRRMSFGPFAGVELYLPSAVMLFVAVGYFNGFLTKLGEEHYDSLKKVAKRLFRRASKSRVSAVGTPGKVSSSGYSLAYSVIGEIAPRLRFKLILQADIDPGDGERAIETFLDFIRNLHAGELDETTLKRLLAHRPVGGTVLMTFDVKTGEIVPVDRIRLSLETEG